MPIVKYYTAQGCLAQGIAVILKCLSGHSATSLSFNYIYHLQYKICRYKCSWVQAFFKSPTLQLYFETKQ